MRARGLVACSRLGGLADSGVAIMSRGSIEIPLRDTDEASRGLGGGGAAWSRGEGREGRAV